MLSTDVMLDSLAPPKNAPKKFTEDEFKDQPTNRITEIMYLMDRLVNLVKANKQSNIPLYIDMLTHVQSFNNIMLST
jgi:hypothetical protein